MATIIQQSDLIGVQTTKDGMKSYWVLASKISTDEEFFKPDTVVIIVDENGKRVDSFYFKRPSYEDDNTFVMRWIYDNPNHRLTAVNDLGVDWC